MEKLLVAKIGGNIVDNEVALEHFLKEFAAIDQPKILIHGGGKIATRIAEKLGVKTQMINGRRITSRENLDIVVQLYAGLINKNIVAALQATENCNAIGFTGADANLIKAIKRPVKDIDYGFVGDVTEVNEDRIHQFLANGLTPVFCAITHDQNGQLFNTNADTIASKIAVALSAYYEVSLYYCFELKGVLKDINDKDSVIEKINTATYNELKLKGIIADGMLPKMENCFDALQKGVAQVHIANATFVTNQNVVHTTLTM
ncbi:acetylglutamate kinase [Aquimarina agarivorans]|uniref:acetylglutamate kinase n=1 Tax=Aquimarina agarivorans TaxID=980584 RepID=UPI000248EB72|nr:acetylglutamate kinase [Aquimarina agarivorans]